MADNKFGFGEVKRKITEMKVDLPVVLANQAQNFFVSSWAKQGWDGTKWKEPNRKIPGTPEYKYPIGKKLGRRTRATLVQTGALRRAVSNSIRSKTFDNVRLVVDLPYAEVHNDGGENMPARPYMKDSPILRIQQQKKIKEFTDKVWRG